VRTEVLDTDITQLEVDAIANAATTQLRHGGGVAGAIARAGGLLADTGASEADDRSRLFGALLEAARDYASRRTTV
jgi:O-acetyl-ADP-ribose deacetylase